MKPSGLRLLFLFLFVICAAPAFAAETATPGKGDADFDKVALDFIGGYLAARPLTGVALGFHQFDGKIGDFTRLAIDAEIERLKRFQGQFEKMDATQLSKRADIDRRILLATIRTELFQIVDMGVYEKNPMTYAGAIGVNIYIKRDFKPLDDRVRDIVNIEDQTGNVLTAARTNLAAILPKPYVELAIEIANGSADFLEKDLVAALKDLKDESLRAAFDDANKKAVAALRDYAKWLTKEKLPKATANFALGAEKFRRGLAGSDMVDLPPDENSRARSTAAEGGTKNLR